MHKDVVNFRAVVAYDVLLGDDDRWMLALPGKWRVRIAARLVVTSAIRVDNRQLRFSSWVGEAHLNWRGWRDYRSPPSPFALSRAAIVPHGITRSMDDERTTCSRDLRKTVHPRREV